MLVVRVAGVAWWCDNLSTNIRRNILAMGLAIWHIGIVSNGLTAKPQGIETMAYRIVKRANSEYKTVEQFDGTYLAAMNRADELQHICGDGEYLVRTKDQPNWTPGTAHQSNMDWL